MTTPTIYLGLDIAKHHLDVDLPAGHRRFTNDQAGLTELFALLPAAAHLVCEASGGYESLLLRHAWAAARAISLVAPQRVRAFARSHGQLANTDRLDCRLLSASARERRPPPSVAPQPRRVQVRALLRTREHLVAAERQEANYREHLGALPLLQELSAQRLALLVQQRRALDAQLRTLLRADLAAHACLQRWQKVQGIGEITAWTLWADLPELGTLAPGQPAALAGLAPQAHDSGQHHGARYVQGGRATVRRVLYMAALSAACHNPVLRVVYQRLRAAGKPAKLALIALARRLVELCNRLASDATFQLAS